MISIITVTFGAVDHIRRCIDSVMRSRPFDGSYEHLIIDNTIGNEVSAVITSEFPHVVFVKNSRNRGFSRAVNQGLKKAGEEAILLLNPDCIVSDGDIEKLVEFLHANPSTGAISPMLITPDGEPQISYARFPRLIPHILGLSPLGWILPAPLKDMGFSGIPPSLDETEPRPVDAPAGSCMLVRRSVYEAIGGLDEDFFMYYEDIEWAYRMKKAGWDRFYLPAVRIIHDMGATWRALPAKRQLYRSYEGKYLYFAKRYGYVAGRLVRTITLVCARLNVILASVLVSLRIGGEQWKRKLQFNRFLLDAHAQKNRMDD